MEIGRLEEHLVDQISPSAPMGICGGPKSLLLKALVDYFLLQETLSLVSLVSLVMHLSEVVYTEACTPGKAMTFIHFHFLP